MTRGLSVALFVVAMIAVIVGVDLLFFRHRFEARLIANVAIVVVFAVLYLAFARRL